MTDLKYFEIIPAIVKNISSFGEVGKGIHIDEYIGKMVFDGSFRYLMDAGISVGDMRSGEFIRNEEKVGTLISLLDKGDAPGAVRDFLNHYYLKISLPKLVSEKTRDAFRLHTVIHRDYHVDNNGAYPLLKFDGQAYRIEAIDRQSLNSGAGRVYLSDQVKPFIRSTLTAAERAGLYEQLEVRLLGSRDLAANEQQLEGQHGVFAAREISAGTCIGVHGGTFFNLESLAASHGISVDELIKMINMDYMVGMDLEGWPARKFFLDGNNIISKINSCFCQDEDGRWRQAEDGYNGTVAAFRCRMDDREFVALSAVFATCNIRSGDEIRMNYHYSPEVVAQTMNTGKIVAKANRDALVKSILSSIA
jgi:hypothetical protein